MPKQLSLTHAILPNAPLIDRIPKCDEDGKPLFDFMMIIPKLRDKPAHQLKQVLAEIQCAAAMFEKDVMYLDLNLKINLLWVSVRPVPGILSQLSAAIRRRVPEALLVANQAAAMIGAKRQRR